MFASEEEIGCGPHAAQAKDGSLYIYHFPVEDGELRCFKTLHIISEYHSLCIAGRTAWVWEAIEVNSDAKHRKAGDPVVIKDVWLDETAAAEKQIRDNIFNDIRLFAGSDFGEDPRLEEFTDELKDELKRILRTEDIRIIFSTSNATQGQASKKRSLGFISTLSRRPRIWPGTAVSNSIQEVCRALYDLTSVPPVLHVLEDRLVGTLT